MSDEVVHFAVVCQYKKINSKIVWFVFVVLSNRIKQEQDTTPPLSTLRSSPGINVVLDVALIVLMVYCSW